MAKRRVNKYPKAFRLMAVERMKTCDNVSALAKELGVDRSVLYHWQNLMPGQGEDESGKSPVRELTETGAGGKDFRSRFFQRCLAESRGSAPERQRLWRDGIYNQIREVMSMQGSLKVERMCELRPFPRPHPCWKINQMGAKRKQCRKLWGLSLSHVKGSINECLQSVEMKTVSMKGFTPFNCRRFCSCQSLQEP